MRVVLLLVASFACLGLVGASRADLSQREQMVASLDSAYAEVRQTTVGYDNSHWSVPPVGSHWAKGLAFLYEAQGHGSSETAEGHMDEFLAELKLTRSGYSLRYNLRTHWTRAMNAWQGARTSP